MPTSTVEVLKELATESELTELDVEEIASQINQQGRQRVDRQLDRTD